MPDVKQKQYNAKWITDRKPTEADTPKTIESHVFGRVFVTRYNTVTTCLWSNVDIGEAWQPITVPEPYVKPKRYNAKWNVRLSSWMIEYKSADNEYAMHCVPLNLNTDEHRQAAERIAAIYNEVMP